MPNFILVERLLTFVNPLRTLLGDRPSLDEVLETEPVTEHAYVGNRDELYDLGRISLFVKQLRDGKILDPIQVEADDFRGRKVRLIDGYHRLAAADLTFSSRDQKKPSRFSSLRERCLWTC
jgi:hypothetical protein